MYHCRQYHYDAKLYPGLRWLVEGCGGARSGGEVKDVVWQWRSLENKRYTSGKATEIRP